MILLGLAAVPARPGTDNPAQVLVGRRLDVNAAAEDDPAPRRFYLDNLGSPFGIHAQITGQYVVTDEYLVLLDCVVTMSQAAHCLNKDGRKVSGVLLFLTSWDSECRWKRSQPESEDAEHHALNHLLMPGENYTVGPFGYAIPLEGLGALEGWRLSLGVVETTYGHGHHYAHSAGTFHVIPRPDSESGGAGDRAGAGAKPNGFMLLGE